MRKHRLFFAALMIMSLLLTACGEPCREVGANDGTAVDVTPSDSGLPALTNGGEASAEDGTEAENAITKAMEPGCPGVTGGIVTTDSVSPRETGDGVTNDIALPIGTESGENVTEEPTLPMETGTTVSQELMTAEKQETTLATSSDSHVPETTGTRKETATPETTRAKTERETTVAHETTKATETKASCNHNWKEITKTVHHEAEGHLERVLVKAVWEEEVLVKAAWDERVLVKAAWDEKILFAPEQDWPIYETHWICNEDSCRLDFTAAGMTSREMGDHCEEHLQNYEASGYHNESVIVGYQHQEAIYEIIHHEAEYKTVHHKAKYRTIRHEAEYKDRWVEEIPAWDETVVTGYRCSKCGAKK